MKQDIEIKYVKRTQKDYSMAFKLSVVGEVERGELSIGAAARKYGIQNHATVTNWLRKHDSFDWENQTPSNMPQTPEQKIMALQRQVRLLEKQKNSLQQQVETSEKKVILFDMMIEPAEKDGAARAVQIPIRKNSSPG